MLIARINNSNTMLIALTYRTIFLIACAFYEADRYRRLQRFANGVNDLKFSTCIQARSNSMKSLLRSKYDIHEAIVGRGSLVWILVVAKNRREQATTAMNRPSSIIATLTFV